MAPDSCARQMISPIGAGVPFGWVAADEAYGQNTPLRDWLEERRVSYVLAVPKSFTVATARRASPRGRAGRGGARGRLAADHLRGWRQGTPVL